VSGLVSRIPLILVAAILGAMRWIVVTGLALVVLLPAGQMALHQYASGSGEAFPSTVSATARLPAVDVTDATAAETGAILAALAQLRYRVPPGAVSVRVSAAPCPNCTGEFQSAFDLVLVEKHTVDAGGMTLRSTLAHELGHYVDVTYLTDNDRRIFMKLRGIPADLDWRSRTLLWSQRPAEDFAEVFSALTVPDAAFPPDTPYGPVRDRAALERLLANAGVKLDRTAPVTDIRRAFAVEFDLVHALLDDPTVSLAVVAVFAFAGLSGALVGGLTEWTRPRP
jgi:hypothetical protein